MATTDIFDSILCCDCIKGMSLINDNSIDLVVTSPPYNLGMKYTNSDDELDWEQYYYWCTSWMLEIFRILKNDGRFCLVHYLSCGNRFKRTAPLMTLNSIAMQIEFKHHGLALWWDTTISRKTAWGSWLSASAPYINSPIEGILVLYKDVWKKLRKGESTISRDEFIEGCHGVWKISSERNRTHPAPFPIAIPKRCINLLTYEGDIVLDPFMGSGTTAMACLETNRHYIGFDNSEEYVEMAKKRINEYVQS